MSLLMDALKKAEAAKRQAAREGGSTPDESGETLATPEKEPSRSPLPELAQHVDSLDFNLDDLPPPQPKRPPLRAPMVPENSKQVTTERQAAQNVFSAKQPPQTRMALWLILGLGGVTAAAIGGYFWWQMQSVSPGLIARPMPAPSTAIAPSPTPASPPPALSPASAAIPTAGRG